MALNDVYVIRAVKAGTHYPYVRAVRTARTYGPLRTYGRVFLRPYLRAVRTARTEKALHAMLFRTNVRTGGVYGTPVYVARTPNVIGYPFH